MHNFLLVINTNLPLILHRFQVSVKFSLERGECLTLTLTLKVIPANIAVSDISLKTGYFGLHFRCRKYRCISSHFYVMLPKTTEFDFSTNRKLIFSFPLLINSNLPPILHRFQCMVQFSLARGECLTLTLSLEVICHHRRK